MKPNQEKLDPKIVAQIKEAREKKKLTQAEVAKKSDITETYYAMIERGEVNPSWSKLEKVFKTLGLKFSVGKA